MKKTRFQRFLAFVLVVCMVIPLLPAFELPVIATATDEPPVVVIAGGDFQDNSLNHSAGATLVSSFLTQMKKDYPTADGFLSVGDYTYDYTYDNGKAGKEAFQGAIQSAYPAMSANKMVWVQGNHDPAQLVTDGVLSSSGAHDADGYGVYVINEKDYMWYYGDSDFNANGTTVKNTAASLKTYLNAKIAAKYTKPIFIVSHLPLHYSMRTKNDGDGMHANYIFDVLNDAGAKGLNIIFMFGHNHSNGWDDYLGGAAIYLAKGDKINIAQASQTNFAVKTLNFTYMNAGYVSYYRNVNSGSETDLTMTVFKITSDNVTVARYSKNGIHDLKSSGVANTYKSESGYSPDTRVYNSTQTITLNKAIWASATNNGVTVSGLGVSGLTVTKKASTLPVGYRAYQTYDITPTGFASGTTATVSIPVDSSFDTSKSVFVIDHAKSSSQVCNIVNGKVTFTTNHFSLYTVAQLDSIDVSNSGYLVKHTIRVNSLVEGVPYVISSHDYPNWVLSTESTTVNNHIGLLLKDEGTVNTEHVWYVKDGCLVYGAADSNKYLQISYSGTVPDSYTGSVTVTDTGVSDSRKAYATLANSSEPTFEIHRDNRLLFLNRLYGGTSDTMATAWHDSGSVTDDSRWYFNRVYTNRPVSITVTADSRTVAVGETMTLKPTVKIDGVAASSYSITWTSSDSTVATVSDGTITAKRSGQIYITATLTAAGGVGLKTAITVEIPITVYLNDYSPDSVSVSTVLGNTLTQVTGSLATGVPYVIKSSPSGYALFGYQATSTTGLKMNPLGGDFSQVWYYDGTYLRYGSASGSYLAYESNLVKLSSSTTYAFNSVYANTTNRIGTFTIKNGNLGSATSIYLNQAGGNTSIAAGLWQQDGNNNAHSAWKFYKVTTRSVPIKMTVTPGDGYTTPGGSISLKPTVTYDGKNTTYNISWGSSDPSIATVNGGVVTGVKTGTVTITAQLTAINGETLEAPIAAQISVQVVDQTVTSSGVSISVTLKPYLQTTTTLQQGVGYIVTPYRNPNWALSNTAQAPALNSSVGGIKLENFYDSAYVAGTSTTYDHLWYYNGTNLLYKNNANWGIGYGTLNNGKQAVMVWGDTAQTPYFNNIFRNNDGWTFSLQETSSAMYLNQHGGKDYNTAFVYEKSGNQDDGSKWRFNTIVPAQTVKLNVSPASSTIIAGKTQKLVPSVTVNGTAISNYSIKWSSSNDSVASVVNGVVSGNKVGSATITATLVAFNGKNLSSTISVQIPVTVTSNGIKSFEISATQSSVTQNSGKHTSTGAYMTVTYEDGSKVDIPVTVGSLITKDGKPVDTSVSGTHSNLVVNCLGIEAFRGFTLYVTPQVENNYPHYPDEGAVFINKTGTGINFQSSGIGKIELSATGIPAKKGADVIVMLDTSSSMNIGMTGASQTRLQVLTQSLNNLLNTLQANGEDGKPQDIKIAIADFNGYFTNSDSNYYINPNDTLQGNFIRTTPGNAEVYTGSTKLDSNAFVDVHTLGSNPFYTSGYSGSSQKKYTLTYSSGTNYDYAFDAIYQLGAAIKEENAANNQDRDLFVIFMSDGAPFQYNYFSSQSGNNDTSTHAEYWNNWLNGTMTDAMYGTNANKNYYNGTGNKHRMAEAIKGDPDSKYLVIRKNDPRDGDGDNRIWMPGLGATMYSIGFCLEKDGKIELATMDNVIKNIASAPEYYFRADTASELTDAFSVITGEINYAATEAYFIDVMGDDYDLQLATVTDLDGNTITPVIQVKAYSIYTRQDVENGLCTEDKIGQRKTDANGNFIYVLLEEVTFNAAGTAAYSNVIGSSTNILKDGIICASTFWYNTNSATKSIDLGNGKTYSLPAETFYWKLGTISTTELTLSYYVYLTGAMEGTRAPGTYDTNESATLNYINYLGNNAKQSVATPKFPWQQATVGYAFYVVNGYGEPIVNLNTGETGSFERALKVTDPEYIHFLLNSKEQTVNAADMYSVEKLRELGYALYDTGAEYHVSVGSNGSGYYTIDSTAENGKNTTYVAGVQNTAVTGSGTTNTTNYASANTVVWFAVTILIDSVPDEIVIDYGLPVDIHVLVNDERMDTGYASLGAIGPLRSTDVEVDYTADLAANFGNKYVGKYGVAEIIDTGLSDTSKATIRYTLNTTNGMQMSDVETFTYAAKYTGYYGKQGYYYATITIIPAANMYYEDSFLTFIDSTASHWTDDGNGIIVSHYNDCGWSEVYAYCKDDTGAAGVWPGVKMTDNDGDNIYTGVVSGDQNGKSVLFNDGGKSEFSSGNLNIYADEPIFTEDGSWYYECTSDQDYQRVYFDNADNWEAVYVDYWGEDGVVTTKKMSVSDTYTPKYGWVVTTMPLTATHVRFHDNNGTQTDALGIKHNYVYSLNGSHKDRSLKDSDPDLSGNRTIYFEPDAYDGTTVYAYCWNSDTSLSPVKMTYDAETGRYSASVPRTMTNVEFLYDMTVYADEPIFCEDGSWYYECTSDQDYQRVYFDNADNWEAVYVDYWGDDGTVKTKQLGTSNAYTEKYGWVVTTLPLTATHVRFHDNNGTQTDALGIKHNYVYSLDGSHKARSLGDSDPDLSGNRTIYFKPDAYDGTTVYAYCWDDDGNQNAAWPGKAMTYNTAIGLYTITVPATMTNVTFNCVEASKIKVSDGGSGQWSSDITVSYDNIHNWDEVYAYCKDDIGVAGRWPGVKMFDTDGDNIYTASVSDSLVGKTVVFNNGDTGDQTNNLSIYADLPIFWEDGKWYYEDYDVSTSTSGNIYVYFNNTDNWSEIYAYCWNEDSNTGWPGEKMGINTTYNKDYGWYVYQVPEGMTNVIFHNNADIQTEDLGVKPGYVYKPDGTHKKASLGNKEPSTSGTRTIYFNPENCLWSEVYAYCWNSSGEMAAWPGTEMTYDAESGLYSLVVPATMTNVVFNNNRSGTQDKTDEVTIVGKDMAYSEPRWEYSSNSTNIYFDNSTSGWSEVYAYFWNYGDTTLTTWPGEKMTLGADGLYYIAVPANAEYIIFNGGSSMNQTVDITLGASGTIYYPDGSSANKDTSDRTYYYKGSWEKVYAHYWSASGGTDWPGVEMTYDSTTGLHSITVPGSMEYIIFNNGAGSQTNDLTLPGENSIFHGDAWVKYTCDPSMQAEDRPGSATDALKHIDADNVYGYDSVYEIYTQHSLSGAPVVKVDAITGHRDNAPMATFFFTGTGFDVVSITDNRSGAIMVEVYPVNDDGTLGNRVRSTIVTNYYGYTYENGEWVVKGNASDCLYQVPVVKQTGLPYGKYKVVIKAAYLASLDAQNNGSYTIWLDAIRTYNPAVNDSTANDAYQSDNEANPSFVMIRDILVNQNSFSTSAGVTGAVFIDGFVVGGNTLPNVIQYANQGPNNEAYLTNGQAIAFELVTNTDVKPTGVHIGAKLAKGSSATLKVNGADLRTITTATNMFYDLNLSWTQNDDGTWTTGTIAISCEAADNSILSLTDMKVTSTNGATFVASANADVDEALETATEPVVFAMVRSRTLSSVNTMVTGCEHSWVAGNCTTPKTCELCGITEGDVVHNYNSYHVCTKCMALRPGQIAGIYGFNISLGGNIALNYYMVLDDSVVSDPDAKMVFEVPESNGSYSVAIPVSEAQKAGSLYVFSCEVAAKEITSQITAQVVSSAGESDTFSYAIVSYANSILAMPDAFAKEIPLVKALLNYCAAAQIYFNHNVDTLANDSEYMTADDKVLSDVDLSHYAYTLSGSEAGVSFYGASLSMESETALKLYFVIEGDASAIDMTVNGQPVTAIKNGSYYEIKISDIAAHQLGNMYEIKVGGLTLNYGAFSYGNKAMSGSNENLKNTIKALYSYYQAAVAYQN